MKNSLLLIVFAILTVTLTSFISTKQVEQKKNNVNLASYKIDPLKLIPPARPTR